MRRQGACPGSEVSTAERGEEGFVAWVFLRMEEGKRWLACRLESLPGNPRSSLPLPEQTPGGSRVSHGAWEEVRRRLMEKVLSFILLFLQIT